ncbi:MAG: class I SAM-dependent methyltransferase [Bacilli bacterium]|nr:class I SAM-dependent methyltransferase [Bacilli bacterium]
MKMNVYDFYKEKYDLEVLNINISNKKILFLIYDEKYYYYLENEEFLTENKNIDILNKINVFNHKYKLDIINFYPVCFCNKTLIIALKTNNSNTILKKYTKECLKTEYQKLIEYHKEKSFTLFVSSNIKKEISMGKKYINRYKFHEKILKRYIFTEKKRCKKEFHELLFELLPNKKSIIDVSCGDNSDIFIMAKKKKYTTIVGNDICLNYLNLNKDDKVIYTNDNIELNKIKENSYDVSFCKNTLHHLNNLTNINNALKFLDKISNNIIIVEIMNPKEYKGMPKFLNKYLYTKFLKDVGNCYLNEDQFINVVNNNFTNHNIEYKTFKNILGTYKIAKISKKGVD